MGKDMCNNIHFVDIGFSNYVEASKILTVNRPDSSPIKRVIQHAKETGNFLDLTQGKKTRSIITQKGENGLVVTASAVQTATIIERIRRAQQAKEVVEKVSDDIVETTIE
jgi:extracellular matrix regulatory protein A